ncbi:unnamed protein product [Mytilus coruscus]|uniref:Ig-like domain-containing protein n=1 Tax=Mytilus coruscus TaxID=42192 RepID=A0A6J8AM54_MYTCO|nr:unnamed protein product [Mytilus coruscus]
MKWLGPPHFTTYTYKDSVKRSLPHFERLSVVGNHSAGEYNLEIRNVSLVDIGEYRCMTTNGTSPVTADIRLELYRPPLDMQIANMDATGVITVHEDENRSLACSVKSGNPVEDMMWKRGNETIAVGGPEFISYSFRPIRDDHLANFTCVANNSDTEIPVHQTIQICVELIPKVKILTDVTRNDILEGSSSSLKCQYDTNVHPITFRWQRNDLLIANGTMEHHQNIHLEIINVSRNESGSYKCLVSNRIGTGSDKTSILVTYKPHTLSANYTFETMLNNPAKILIQVESYEKPIALWAFSVGGTVGIWDIRKKRNSSMFILSSTVVPKLQEEFGIYGARIRNAAGSIDIKVNVYQSDIPVSVSAAHTECNVSSTAVLKCFFNVTTTEQLTCIWKHYIEGTYVRSVEGINHGNMSALRIAHCNPEDEGEYKCVVKINGTEFSSSTILTVNGPPFVVNTSILFDHWLSIISVYFYSKSVFKDPVWYLKMNNTLNSEYKINVESNTFNQSTSTASIRMNKYGVQVNIPGNLLVLITSRNLTKKDILICQLQNVYGTTEIPFYITNAREEYFAILPKDERELTTVSDPVLSGKGIFQVYSLYIYISCVVLVLFVFIIGSLMVQNKLKSHTTEELTVPLPTIIDESFTRRLSNSMQMVSSTHAIVSLNSSPREQNIESESDSSLYEYPMSCPVIDHLSYDYVDNTKLDIHFYDICKEKRTHDEKGNVIGNSDDTISSYTVPHNAYLVVLGSTNSFSIRNDTLAADLDKRKSLETFEKRNQLMKDSASARKRLHSI